jgi:hypothetical protein
MEIDRLNEEKANLAIKTAAEMAEKDKKLAALQAMLVASGLVGVDMEPIPGTSSFSTTTAIANKSHVRYLPQSQPVPSNLSVVTPSRKRHSSQQLVRAAKDSRVGDVDGRLRNRFDILTQADSYPDKSMRPCSISSTRGVISTGAAITPMYAHDFPTFANSSKSIDPIRGNSSWGNGARPARLHIKTVPNASSLVEGAFAITNEGAFREELEIALDTINGQPFNGSITRQEAKVEIYRRCLGFSDFSNFDGVRLGYKNGPIIVFKLKKAINVDELYNIQNFNYNRRSTRQGAVHIDIIRCKIRGLRDPSRTISAGPKENDLYVDDGTRLVKIKGCEYRVPREVLMAYLSHFGQVVSEIMEEVFEVDLGPEECDDGTNRTGDYTVKIKLTKDLPQIAPIMGKRVKFFYRGIQKLCTKCFGNHNKQVCKSRKIPWIGYVAQFKELHPEIPSALYGKWFEIVTKKGCPASVNPAADASMSSLARDGPKSMGSAQVLPQPQG